MQPSRIPSLRIHPSRILSRQHRPVQNIISLDEILDNIDMYNKEVEDFNTKFIEFLKTSKSDTETEKTSGGGDPKETLIDSEKHLIKKSKQIDNYIDQYLQQPGFNLDEIFEKTQYYWYDEHLKEKMNKNGLIKFFLQRLKKKVIPVNNIDTHYYDIKLDASNNDKYFYMVTQENTYIESLMYSRNSPPNGKILCYVCFNEHPFNKTYINEGKLTEEDSEKQYYIWLKVNNEIYIYPRLPLGKVSGENVGIKSISPTLLKNLLILHPYLFFDITTKPIFTFDAFRTSNPDIEYVPILQGSHYLCWLCTILNVIKLYKLHEKVGCIQSEYQDIVNLTMKTQSVLDFIKYFDYRKKTHKIVNVVSKFVLKLPKYNRGNLPSTVIKSILTDTGLWKLSELYVEQLKKINQTTDLLNPLPIIIHMIHVVPIYIDNNIRYYYDSTIVFRTTEIIDPENKIPYFKNHILQYSLDYHTSKVESSIVKPKHFGDFNDYKPFTLHYTNNAKGGGLSKDTLTHIHILYKRFVKKYYKSHRVS